MQPLDFTPRQEGDNGKWYPRSVAIAAFTVSAAPTTVSARFATPSGSQLSPSGQQDLVRRAGLMVGTLMLPAVPTVTIADLTLSWFQSRAASVTLGQSWVVSCELLEGNRLSPRIVTSEDGADPMTTELAVYSRVVAYAMQTIGTSTLTGMAD